ncbi:hypothetical protein GCM10022243_63940 [Saccharothrix violaceirubra]|uniref:CRP-like cAMP-binding protein n=1 Tax=Saccharothrix violaceirubra TaxID=413306 RepID=A0A7W7WZQ9_9PSEU|nr:Crp/Fnr family transcriptional regulator [Saccharothrix violaceirubra]MBB4969121.1 CRP-like cAMP-binding protein [Saccharothrix violaceirubra]
MATPAPRWLRGSMLDLLPPPFDSELLRLGRSTQFDVGATLVEQGARESPVLVLVGGVVKMTRTARQDSPPMLISLRMPGEALGVATAWLGKQSHVTYTAAKASNVVAIPREAFTKFVRDHEPVMNALCAVLASEACLRDASLAYATMGVEARLIAFLGRQQLLGGVSTPAGIKISLGLSQADFAAAIGASQPAVAKALAKLRNAGVLTVGYRSVYIRKRLGPESPPVRR